MCGIVGYVGERNSQPILLDGLKRLEYRGYDSAGLAVVGPDRRLRVEKCRGKIIDLEQRLLSHPLVGHLGVGHTRWATHGAPSDENAHPHTACCSEGASKVTVVHNGIIENHEEVRRGLAGHRFSSQTDTEVVAHLVESSLNGRADLRKVLSTVAGRMRGAYALGVLVENEPDLLVAMRRGSPLVIGLGEKENFIASDIPALLPHTRRLLILEDGDMAFLRSSGVEVFDVRGRRVRRREREITWTQAMAEKGGYKHFMLKEIFEQPHAVADTLRGRLNGGRLAELNGLPVKRIERVVLTACGTSYHASLLGKAALEQLAHCRVESDIASECRYRPNLFDERTLVVAVSQSGETADTLAAVETAREGGAKVLAICNVVDSSLARAADAVLYTRAGPEIGVASTKTFTTQIAVLLVLALDLAERRGAAPASVRKAVRRGLGRGAAAIDRVLAMSSEIREKMEPYAAARNLLYIGRGRLFPIALEGALKLKEISYIHAEAYAAGELKHGPIALIDENMPVVVFVAQDETLPKMMSNVEEVRSRGAKVIAVTAGPVESLKSKAAAVFSLPPTEGWVQPIPMAVVTQLMAYHIAVLKGTDVDQPRNLAKSVTVE
ncbi:MAG: glutamine--fructose-6-phosphate transaminase (isomerizing) [Nitrospirae bacterium]|nr:glutamine--fructose-6-phosphate transaminase (isomerizing) [Nitrospirota bacterium]